ncbi:MAG: class I SAM-dependent methyltransferase, partial [Acidobacteriota bacterium]|nr:class I SAM-dependent methyltransferase [Acidobacteriota bacterium]
SATDPNLHGDASSLKDFQANIERLEVADKIEFHQTFSHELAKNWTRPLRFLWIDGDHTYRGTKLDFDGFAPFLTDGAIVAMHDVLHAFDGGVRVFMEDILLSPNFGACGFCGSIGWAQYRTSDAIGERFRAEKFRLYRKLSRLIPHIVFGKELRGLEKKIYKLKRSRIPRRLVEPNEWLTMVS